MDNVTSPPDLPSACVIKLNKFQYAAYRQSRLEIHTSRGQFLTRIAPSIKITNDDDAIFQLWCQATLLEVLFDQIQIKLPQKTISSIVRIVDRLDVHIKKQMSM
ncbi:MAG TPA: hypothetical protein VL995_22090 [Cellvibrio sp.]|nr:hypothetical protein [Cellvibrio sp.]